MEWSRPQSAADRREPLPGVAGLPVRAWRRLPPVGRVAVALIPVAAIVLALVLGPGIDRAKDERSRSEQARRERATAREEQRIRAQQRPRSGRTVAAGASLAARSTVLDDTSRAVAADARSRVATGELAGPIRRVQCEPFPPSRGARGAERDPGRRYGRYACLAVTSEVPATERNEAAVIGHPYRVRIDFRRGRYALCKVTGRPGEGSLGTGTVVPVPRACGGG